MWTSLQLAHRGDMRFDLTSDGVLDLNDLARLIQDVLGTNYGDANLDGKLTTRRTCYKSPKQAIMKTASSAIDTG